MKPILLVSEFLESKNINYTLDAVTPTSWFDLDRIYVYNYIVFVIEGEILIYSAHLNNDGDAELLNYFELSDPSCLKKFERFLNEYIYTF